MSLQQDVIKVMNKLTKWRGFYAMWQLGSRPREDPERAAVADHRELSIILRAELSAMLGLMVDKGVFTENEFLDYLRLEAAQLNEDYSKAHPGFWTSDVGMHLNAQGLETLKKWRPQDAYPDDEF